MKYTCKQCRSALVSGIFVLAATSTFQAHAQTFNDGTTNAISTDTTYNETLMVGSQNPDNTLIILSNATVSATEVVIGQIQTSTNNLVSVVGGSRLVAGNATTNGLATGGIVVGDNDGNAAISLRNASSLNADYLYVGFGTNDSGKIELTGTDTELNVADDAFVGHAGSTNSLEIGSGAALNIGGNLNVGFAGGSNNVVNVNSGGSLFVNSTNNINVVGSDADNSISIKGGGTLQVGGNVETGTMEDLGVELASNAKLEVGGALTLTGNKIDDSLGIILNNALSTNSAIWNSSSLATIGKTTSNNSLTITNGATATTASILQLGSGTFARNNTLAIGGAGSRIVALDDVMVGALGDNNKLTVTDGGQATVVGSLYLGNNAGATDNGVNVGSNGVLSVGDDIVAGDYGSDNTFTIADGQVDVANNFILGSSSIGNRYFHTGGTNTVAGEFIIGRTEDASGVTTIGASDTSGNLGAVGTNATLDIQQNLTVGQKGEGSILLINDGGIVNVTGDAVIGEASDDNYIFLQPDNPDSRFNVASNLVVGKEGGNNRFAIYGGTADIGGNLYLGSSTNQHELKNYIHLETTNAVLNVANAIHIGASNSVNTLDLVGGAKASAQDLLVGTYEGVSDNVVTVTGDDSLLSITNTLAIGSNTGSNNAVTVQNGGTLEVEQSNIAMGSGTNNMLNIADGGILKTLGWDFAAQTNTATNIVFEAGSTLHLLGVLAGTNMIDGSMNVVLDGAASSWDTTTNMYVGYETDNNTLTLTNGATASTITNLYIGFASEDNTVTVGGAGSLLDIGMDLFIGTESNKSAYNSLTVLDGASVMVDRDAYLYRRATLKIDSTSQVTVGGNYEQDEFSTLEVGISTNQVAPNLQVAGKANLASGATLSVYNDGIGVDDTNVVQNIVVANELTIDDKTATTGLLLDSITIKTNLLLDFTTTVSNNNTIVLDNFIVRSIGEAADLDGQLLDVADEINEMKDAGNSNAVEMARIIENMSSSSEINAAFENYYGEKQSSTPANNIINLGLQSVAEQLTMRADNTRVRTGAASAAVNWNKPEGTAGPHMDGQQLQGWLTGYGTWADKKEADGFGGYDGTVRGFLIGADLAVADGILVGVAGGSGNATVDKENSASTDTKTIYGSVYASAGTKDWFADASLIYGGSSIDSTLGTAFDTTAEYDAQNIALYLGGGKEMAGKYLIFTPQASLLGNYYKQDAYQEKSSNAVGRDVDSFDAFYLQSSVGGSMGLYTGMGNVTIKPELRAYWLHEWNAKEENLDYSLIGGTGQYTMILQAPEQDLLKIGAGASAKIGEYLELRADLDSRLGKDYKDYTLLGSIRYQF